MLVRLLYHPWPLTQLHCGNDLMFHLSLSLNTMCLANEADLTQLNWFLWYKGGRKISLMYNVDEFAPQY